MKKYLVLIILFISSLINFCYAQGVAVNTNGSTADPSAMLDVNATNKGILIPRVTSTASITSPVVGLLIFQTTAPVGFYYYDGATWDYLQNSANASITLQGNSFNTAGTLLKLDAAGKVPLANLGTSGTPSASTYLNGNDTWVTVPAGLTNGSAAGQIYLTGSSPFAPQAPQSVTGDISINSTAVTSYNNIVPSNKGGAGAVNGILSANGAGTVSAAPTTGSGNVVLAASPTLVTPSLGTPSALVGTNISGTAANLTAGNVTTDANLTGAVTSVGNATSYNSIVPIAKGGTGTGTTPSLVGGTNVTITGTWPNQTIAAASGGSSPAGFQYKAITSGSTTNTITVTDNTVRTIVGDLGGTTGVGTTLTYTLPSAASYAAGTVITYETTGYSPSVLATIIFISPSSTISALNLNNVSTASPGVSLTGISKFAVVSDGVSHWYRYN